MGRVTSRAPALRIELTPDGPRTVSRPDTLTVEEPLEIRVDGRALSVTMRTPGDDFDLTLGFLLTEGLVGSAGDVARLMHCLDSGEDGRPTYNVVDVTLAAGVAATGRVARAVLLHDVLLRRVRQGEHRRGPHPLAVRRAAGSLPVLAPEVLMRLPGALRAAQKVFDRTGGLHAAGLFTADGELLVVREDVGRHNAVDKVVGWAAREGRLPLSDHVLMVSGRASFELTQKASMAGIPVLAAVSAPSHLAVELAEQSRAHPGRLPASTVDDRLRRSATAGAG